MFGKELLPSPLCWGQDLLLSHFSPHWCCTPTTTTILLPGPKEMSPVRVGNPSHPDPLNAPPTAGCLSPAPVRTRRHAAPAGSAAPPASTLLLPCTCPHNTLGSWKLLAGVTLSLALVFLLSCSFANHHRKCLPPQSTILYTSSVTASWLGRLPPREPWGVPPPQPPLQPRGFCCVSTDTLGRRWPACICFPSQTARWGLYLTSLSPGPALSWRSVKVSE